MLETHYPSLTMMGVLRCRVSSWDQVDGRVCAAAETGSSASAAALTAAQVHMQRLPEPADLVGRLRADPGGDWALQGESTARHPVSAGTG